jgi:hypothetical protein
MKLHPRNAALSAHTIREILELEDGLFLMTTDTVVLEHSGCC